jgi:Spy/CpxP family protein refolding chaperone
MKSTSVRIAAPLLALMVTVGTLTAVAQTKTAPEKSKAAASKKDSSKYHRLPSNFGKLELTEEQVQEIYSIKDTMGPKIEELAKEMAALKADQDQKIKDVLTRTQVTAFNKLKAGTAKADEESSTEKPAPKKSSTKKKPSEKPTEE